MTQKTKKLYGLLFFSRSRVIISSTCRHLKERKKRKKSFTYIFLFVWIFLGK
jgi:predicted nucleic acid-binding Zn ribbon protein